MANFKRAITEEQKAKRKQAILDAARELFSHSDFHVIKVSEIAKKAGIGKGSIFLYFKSKEELFIYLAMEEFEESYKKFKSFLDSIEDRRKISGSIIIEILEKTFLDNDILIRLLTISNIILEQNINYEEAMEYKSFFNDHIIEIGKILEENIIFFQEGDGVKFMMYCFALIIGLYQMSHPPTVIQQVLESFEYPVFNVDFKSYYIEMINLILNGMESSFNNRMV